MFNVRMHSYYQIATNWEICNYKYLSGAVYNIYQQGLTDPC